MAEDSGDSDEFPLFQSVRSRSKRFRSAHTPPLPNTVRDVAIAGEWAQNWRGKTFLRLLNNNVGVAVFASRRMIVALQKSKRLFIDGTFKTAPKSYKQLVTVHGEIDGFVIPVAFVLATGKLCFQYRRVLQELKC